MTVCRDAGRGADDTHWTIVRPEAYLVATGFVRLAPTRTLFPDGVIGCVPPVVGRGPHIILESCIKRTPDAWVSGCSSSLGDPPPNQVEESGGAASPLLLSAPQAPWRVAGPFLRRALGTVPGVPWAHLEKLWDVFNRYVRSLTARECAGGNLTELVVFHEKVAREEACLLEKTASDVAPFHKQLRSLWRHCAFFSWEEFHPMADDICRVSEMWQRPLSLGEVETCWSVLTTLRRDQVKGAVGLSRKISQWMPAKDDRRLWLQRVVALTYAKARFRLRHGSMAALSVNLSESDLVKSHFPIRFYMERLANSLDVSYVTLLEIIGTRGSDFREYLECHRPLPVAWLERLLNVLEMGDPSWLAYCWFKEDLDPHFEVKCAPEGVTLRSPVPLRSMATYREVGLGGLCRAARFAGRLSKEGSEADPDLPCERKKLFGIERNRPLDREQMTIKRGLIRYFGLGAAGALAVFPDVPRLIPTSDPTGRLVEDPAIGPYHLRGYAPRPLSSYGGLKPPSHHGSQATKEGTLGHRLRYERALFGINTAELAQRMERRREVIDRLESGKFPPSLGLLKALAWRSGFEVSLEEWADLANKSSYNGSNPPSMEGFLARLPILLSRRVWGDDHDKGDPAKLEIYRRHYQTGAGAPSLGELCFFLRKNLWRLERAPRLSLTHKELARKEFVDIGTFHDPEYNRRPLKPEELVLFAQVYGVNPRLFTKAIQSTFSTYPDYRGGVRELARLAPRLFELSDQLPLTRSHFLNLA